MDSQNSKTNDNTPHANTATETNDKNTPASRFTANTNSNGSNALATSQPNNPPAVARMPSPINVSSTKSVESRLFQALEDVETRSGLVCEFLFV